MATPKFLECNLCGKQQPYEPFVPAICAQCGGQWMETRYDYAAFKREILRGLPGRPANMWRYSDILPLDNPAALELYPAGGTPLWLSQRFAPALGHDHVYFKDERYGPTSSFKDRQAAVAVAAMNEGGIREAVIASTGNAAVAYAAACARAGIKLWVFMTSLVPQEKLRSSSEEHVHGHILDAGQMPEAPDDGMLELWLGASGERVIQPLPDFVFE